MGANAQTTVPTFTASQVLTADQMNQSARTGVPVFATTVERDAAFGGSGEKTLAEGQLCYLESTNVVQYYDGAAWATVGPATASGLVFITSATVGTGVASVQVSGAFSSTYANYLVTMSGVDASTGGIRMRLTFGATTTNYYSVANTFSTGGTDQINRTNNGTYIEAGYWGTSDASSLTMTVYNPNVAQHTTVTGSSVGTDANGTDTVFATFGGGLEDSTQYTAFTLAPSTGTITGGTIRVYGIANS
jgi:hypothetical protein